MYVIGDADGYASIASLAGAPLAEQVPVDLDDVVVLPYSSGTTGLAKGVMLTHRNLVSNIEQTLGTVAMDEDDAFVAVLPFFHIYGMQVLMNIGLRAGATIVTMPRFDLEQFLSLHQEHRLTRAFVAPPMVVALAKHPVVDNYDLSALRWILSGAAPLSAELAIECGQRLGCEVVQGYGMTELSPVSHATPSGMFKPGSVGVTVPNTEVNIVDPATRVAARRRRGRRGVGSRPAGDEGLPEQRAATKSTIDDDGWLHTGDIGHIDADGHLFVVDRLKELIKYKGFQVPPAELEALLLTHPQIADAAVIGLPDDEAGEIPAAYVVLKQGQDATAADIQALRRGEGRELQAGPQAHVRRRDPEVGVGQDPASRPARPSRLSVTLRWLEVERHRVHAVAVARRRSESVGEHVAEVRATARTPHFRSHHAHAAIFEQLDGLRSNRFVEARPTAAGVELRARLEQLVPTRLARVQPRPSLVEQCTRPRAFRCCLTEHSELLCTQPAPPVALVVFDFVLHVPAPLVTSTSLPVDESGAGHAKVTR